MRLTNYNTMKLYTFTSPNKLSFRGPGGVGRGLDSVGRPKSVRGNWPLWSPVVSRGLPWSPVVYLCLLCLLLLYVELLGQNLCAASVVSRCLKAVSRCFPLSPVVSRGLPLSPVASSFVFGLFGMFLFAAFILLLVPSLLSSTNLVWGRLYVISLFWQRNWNLKVKWSVCCLFGRLGTVRLWPEL